MYEDDTIGRSRMLPPLPERMRPHDLDGYYGQKHLIGKGGIIRNMIENGNLSSFILWGPPGVGKTTLSRIVAKSLKRWISSMKRIGDSPLENKEFERALSITSLTSFTPALTAESVKNSRFNDLATIFYFPVCT